MSGEGAVAVWSSWRLHADAVVSALAGEKVHAATVEDPDDVSGLLVASAVVPDAVDLVARRQHEGRLTIVWGGTLPPPRVAALRAAGAAAYVSLLAGPFELAGTVRRVAAGGSAEWPHPPAPMSSLTPRERQVAEAYLVAEANHTAAEVARGLGISERTLKVHVANIRGKTGHRGTSTRDGLRQELTFRGWLV